MSSLKTKEIVVDVVMEVMVTQRFEVPMDYEFDEYDDKTSYIKLLNDYGSDTLNLTENIDFEDIDSEDVIEVYFRGVADVNMQECKHPQIES